MPLLAPKTKDVFERWTPIWHAFLFLMIVAATAIVLAQRSAGASWQAIGLVIVLTVWHALMMVWRARGLRERPQRVGIYLVGAIVLAGLLVAIDPVFLMIGMTLYNQVFAFMVMRWAIPFAIALTVAIGSAMMRTGGTDALLVPAIGAGSAFFFARFLSATGDENQAQRALIEELEHTREQLVLAERLAGVTEERHRIARELHDTVTQQLIGIVMHLDAASESVDAHPERAKDALDRSLVMARDGLAEARRLVWAERPRQLDDGSLTRALTTAIERLASDTGLSAQRVLPPDLDGLPAAVQTLVLRGVQEALANIRKHAKAQTVTVTVSAEDDLVTVDVHDDGVGFDARTPDARRAEGSGFGLRALRERVEALGGTLSVESEQGRGTTVAFHVPLKAREGA